MNWARRTACAFMIVAATAVRAEWQTIRMGEESVEIFRDAYGIPHVYAKSFRGIYFGGGHAAAEDRLWQMEMYRRDAKGELAELLGEEQLDKDRRTRGRSLTNDERRDAFDRLDPEMKTALEAYRDGVNAYIAEAIRTGTLPPGYAAIRSADGSPVVPRSWDVTDTLAIIEMMAERFGSGGTEELEYKDVYDRLTARFGKDDGRAVFNDLIPLNDRDAPTTMPKTHETRYRKASLTPNGANADAALSRELARPYLDARAADLAVAQEIGSFTGLGSNAWVVAPKRSKSGNAILFGGPMMGFRAPQIAHEIHLNGPARANGSGTMNVLGMTMAGLPFVLIGTNAVAAWTTTSGGGNVSDLYVETLDPENPNRYRFDDNWRDIERIPSSIRVRNADGTLREVPHELLRTVHGPIVSMDAAAGTAVSVKHSYWEGDRLTALGAFLEFNRMASVEEFVDACSRIPTTHNFFYADQNGDIAYAWVGKYPIRPIEVDPRLPMRGNGVDEWLGYIPFEELPKARNPEQGWFGNWNNKPSDDWDSPFGRVFWGHRIYERLAADDAFTLEDCADLAWETGTNDFLADYFHESLMRAIGTPQMRERDDAKRLAETAADYDGVLGVGSAGERVYDTFARSLIRAMFADEMPFLFERRMNDEALLLLLSLALRTLEPDVSYLKPSRDYLNGMSPESILAVALDMTLNELGSDPSQWNGTAREIRFGEYARIPWARRGTYMQAVELSNPPQGGNALPPGQSENPNSPHFGDQLELYRNWAFKPIVLERSGLTAEDERGSPATLDETLKNQGGGR